MGQNTLYNFISLDLHALKKITLQNCSKISHCQDKKENAYNRFDLMHNKKIIFAEQNDELTLIDHHISIYQSENTNNPSLSQYHYTAYFTNKEGVMYQLHIYFNNEDELTQMPVLSINENSGTYKPVIIESSLQEKFIELGLTYTQPIINKLRQLQDKKIQALENHYLTLEATACSLSENIEKNFETYINVLEEMQTVLLQLDSLVQHSSYQKNQKIVEKMIEALRAPVLSPTNIIEPDSPSSPISPAVNQPAHSSSAFFKEPQKIIKADIASEINKLWEEYRDLEKKPTLEKIEKLADISFRINLLLANNEKNIFKGNLTSFSALQRLERIIYQDAEKLCAYLLFNKNFEAVTKLPNYPSLLGNTYLNLALCTHNAALLNFVLTHSNLSFVNQPITINNTQYSSAAHYCIQANSEKNPMQECLAVLIKHGESILTKGADHLPLAYHLIDPNNSLHKAVADNKEKTLNSMAFCKSYSMALKTYLASPYSDRKRKQTIEEHIQYFDTACSNLLPELHKPAGKRLVNSIINLRSTAINIFDHQTLEQIKKDPDVNIAIIFLENSFVAFTKKLSPVQRKRLLNQTGLVVDNIENVLKIANPQNLDFNTLKKITCDYLYECASFYNKLSEVTDLKKKLNAKPQFKKQESRQRKQDVKRHAELVKEVNALSKKYTFLNSADIIYELTISIDKLRSTLEDLLSTLNQEITFFKPSENTPAASNYWESLGLDNDEPAEESIQNNEMKKGNR